MQGHGRFPALLMNDTKTNRSGSELIPALSADRCILGIRGEKVILDADLAGLYGVTPKALNQAVKRNSARLPGDFAFLLTPEEKTEAEEDLDNQTIFEDVIKLVRVLKRDIQFVFATHNANFPVLGDAEQVGACSFAGGHADVRVGSIDDPEIQKASCQLWKAGRKGSLGARLMRDEPPKKRVS
jgi:hypothetical protein